MFEFSRKPKTSVRTKTVNGIELGSKVNWESQGAIQFKHPRKVTGISNDGEYVLVEGSKTGLPANQLVCVEAPEAQRHWSWRFASWAGGWALALLRSMLKAGKFILKTAVSPFSNLLKAAAPHYTKLPLGAILFAAVSVALIAFLSWEATRATSFSWNWAKSLRMPSLPWAWIGLTIVAICVVVLLVRNIKWSMPSTSVNWKGVGRRAWNFAVAVFIIGGAYLVYRTLENFKESENRGWHRDLADRRSNPSGVPQVRASASLNDEIAERGVALPEERTEFVYTIMKTDNVPYAVPKGYCIHAKRVDGRKAFFFETNLGTVLDSPLSPDPPLVGQLTYFRFKPYGSQLAQVKVVSYPCD